VFTARYGLNLRVMYINPSRPSGHYIYHQFNIQPFYVMPTQFIYVFLVNLSRVFTARYGWGLDIIKSNLQYAADLILVLYILHEILTVEKRKKSDNRSQKVSEVPAQHQSIRTRLSPAGVQNWWPNYHCTSTALLMNLSTVATCSLQPARASV
jgi:hypothetical protein